MREIINTATSVITLLVLVFGGLKFYYLLEQHPPHTHTERGDQEPLTTRGLMYPRGTKNGNS